MTAQALSATQAIRTHLLLPFLSALGIVMFLFFIDEGYYDFRWMGDPGNWIVFGLYMGIMFLFQWLISHFLLRRLHGTRKAIAMLAGVMPATIILFLWLVS